MDPATKSDAVHLRHSSSYQDTDQLTPGVVVPLRSAATAPNALISAFASRYANPKTRHQYEAELTALFANTGRGHPRDLTEADVLAWCGRPAANNTIRPITPLS